MASQEIEIASPIMEKVYSRSQFMDMVRSAGLGGIFGLLSGTSLGSLAYALTRPKLQEPETIDPVIVYKTENLTPEETKEFNEKFDSLLINLKESNAQTIDQPQYLYQGYRFELRGRIYSLVTTARHLTSSAEFPEITSATKILGVTSQEGSLFFMLDQNQFITAIQRKPLSSPTLESITNNGLSIDSDHRESIRAFEKSFEKWKTGNTPQEQPNITPTPEAL